MLLVQWGHVKGEEKGSQLKADGLVGIPLRLLFLVCRPNCLFRDSTHALWSSSDSFSHFPIAQSAFREDHLGTQSSDLFLNDLLK